MRLTLLTFAALVVVGCAAAGPAEIVALEMTEFGFSPARIEIQPGQTVEIVLSNPGTLEHDFTIESWTGNVTVLEAGSHAHSSDADVHIAVTPGETGRVRLTVTEPGEYVFFCSVSGHRDAGMAGNLIVVAP